LKYRDLRIVITEMKGMKIEKIKVSREKHAAGGDKTGTSQVG